MFLTQSAPERYGPSAAHLCRPRQLEEVCQHALWLRRHLGLCLAHAHADDAWTLAAFYADRAEVFPLLMEEPGLIVFQPGRKDLILLADDLGSWEEAHVLAHEFGHCLFTRPGCDPRTAEVVAEAFARAFLCIGLGELDTDGLCCCRVEN